MPQQEPLTIVAEVNPERATTLDPVLAEMRADPAHNRVLPFGELPGCHFGRVVLLPASEDLDGRPIAPQLILLTDCDGSARAHVEAIATVAGAGLDRLFGACDDYPRGAPSREDRLAFLRRHMQRVDATYVHRQGRTVEQIRGEAELREALLAFVDQESFAEGVPALEVRKRIRAFLRNDPQLRWALRPPARLPLGWRARRAIDAASLPLGLVVFGPVVLPAALLLLILVRLQEERDGSDVRRPSPEHVRRLTELEDFFAHNGFTAGGYVKRGVVRQAVIRSVLPLIGWGTRNLFTRDSLAGVKTIHFARWIPLDGGRRVVFASNYDGSLEAYNNDFIDLVAWGLNLVFSNGHGYPRTRWLLFGGATREQEFKDYLRRHQIPTPVWYSAYPHLTAVNIQRNAKLRAGLRARMNEREAREWLHLL
jgi:hypothetical protein